MLSNYQEEKMKNRSRSTNDPYIDHIEITMTNKLMKIDTRWIKMNERMEILTENWNF